MRSTLGAGPPSGTFPILIFIPSIDRAGQLIGQAYWRDEALTLLARLFRGATALPPGRGAWRSETGEVLLEDTAVVFSIADPEDVTEGNVRDLGRFARRMGREANQGEVGLILGDRYHPITNYEEMEHGGT